MREYKVGEKVRFMDASGTVSDGSVVKAEGIVNGPMVRHEDGTPAFLPVFCERDKNREPTTIFVNPSNLLAR